MPSVADKKPDRALPTCSADDEAHSPSQSCSSQLSRRRCDVGRCRFGTHSFFCFRHKFANYTFLFSLRLLICFHPQDFCWRCGVIFCVLSSYAFEEPPDQTDFKHRRTSFCGASRCLSKLLYSRPTAEIWSRGETTKKEVYEPQDAFSGPADRDPCCCIPCPPHPVRRRSFVAKFTKAWTTRRNSMSRLPVTMGGHRRNAQRASSSLSRERHIPGMKTKRWQSPPGKLARMSSGECLGPSSDGNAPRSCFGQGFQAPT